MAITTVLACWSCSHVAPAGFWTRYHSRLIVFNKSDQGPRGGLRVVLWTSPRAGTFTERSIRAHAGRHGWRYVDRVAVSSAELATWVSHKDRTPYFVLFDRNDEVMCLRFPRHISTDSVILRFDSGWMREDPGTSKMSPAFGCVQIDREGTRMAVYHFWGNG